jgi:transcriptional regulator with XRE-family HTH domain
VDTLIFVLLVVLGIALGVFGPLGFRSLRRTIVRQRRRKIVKRIKERTRRPDAVQRRLKRDYHTMADCRVEIDGELLRVARELRDISAREFARHFGFTANWTGFMERGESLPYWHDVRLMAEWLGNVTQEELLVEAPTIDMHQLPPPPTTFVWLDGAELRRARQKRNYTQQQMANKIDRNVTHYRRIENQIAPSEVDLVGPICTALHLKVKEVLVFQKEMPDETAPLETLRQA